MGHAWVKRLFLDRDYRGSERAEDYRFIPARVYDNPVLMQRDPGYVRTLENLPEHLRRAYLEGDWDVLAGQYFPEFRRDAHVIEPIALPGHWRRFAAMDWGYHDPCAVLWLAVADDGRVYVYRELYLRHTLSSEIARRMKQLQQGERIAYTVASPDAWQRRGLADLAGQSIADSFAAAGVPLLRADNARVPGWQRVREYLAPADGGPRLRIFSCCTNLVRTLPLLRFDAHDAEDVADGCEDHAPEALRYALMSRPAPARRRSAPPARPAYDPFAAPAPPPRGFEGL